MTIYSLWQRFWLLFISVIPFGWTWSSFGGLDAPWKLRWRALETLVYAAFVLRVLLARIVLKPESISYRGVIHSWTMPVSEVRTVEVWGFPVVLGNGPVSGGGLAFRDYHGMLHRCPMVSMRTLNTVLGKTEKIISYLSDHQHVIKMGSPH